MIDIILSYFSRSTFITIFVLSWLSFYFILTFTILISRFVGLSSWQKKEEKALESMLMGARITNTNSILKKSASGKITKEKLAISQSMAERDSTSGLTWLSIIASTSPFIGLFGTVVSILDTFSKMGGGNASIATIAPAISEALVATGAGIFVAIPAYTFHLLIRRKSYEIMSIIGRTAEILLYMSNENSSNLRAEIRNNV
ncbi:MULTISPECIES: MotA/TolQ/ExbB proton channel family protein [unclassified Campylobacter]|uniref:MotA/TolQ/ExbB proton channel family protein n=1 Tax=unclassified Campylobacter TaxID=2593542 RepID=UPI0022E9C6BD|nr:MULTISPECIES: MotA/TolQ/ExbB proton channel family protein [unclassified Campylobacter]MDA3080517.1 MotA/TolQ/ExbB proton channel family protein [Campylobacter sp. CS_NA1]MDA3085278.1 MotA/TolQ/ExbB proton channel family protein [Campylobacter sp. CS_ED1]MDA3090055.1 MotA/TolQ/ExbB proton channel family protein [Campylobacter sp. CS_ED2]WBR51406.1 MotA/TolQ/ExbB proton channel family protein [Campylobacter sp. CS_NA3]